MTVIEDARLPLPEITLVAVTSVNIAATIEAIEKSIALIRFGGVKIITHEAPAGLPAECEWIAIPPVETASAYSSFVLGQLADYVATTHCLLIQWDGHVLRSDCWRPEFLEYDYIGAGWPQFDDGHDVGNGGFSLRSRALLEACRADGFRPSHPEDVAIGRGNRDWLEARGLRFAPLALADKFSAERRGNVAESFGYHGIWHMPLLLGRDRFWKIYSSLDERRSARHDFLSLLKQVAGGTGGVERARCLIQDQLGATAPFRKLRNAD